MAKTLLTKKDLIQKIEEKIQQLQLLQSVVQGDKSRKPEALEGYKKQFEEVFIRK